MDHYLTISIVNVYKTRVRYTSFTYLLYSCQNQQLNLAVLFDMHPTVIHHSSIYTTECYYPPAEASENLLQV